MKKFFLISLLFMASMIASAQSNNFYSNGDKIYWQMVYEEDTDIIALLANSGRFEQISEVDGVVYAHMIPGEVDLKGRRRGTTPMFLLHNMTFFVKIQQKEGRYRVTCDRFVFIQNITTALSEQGETTPLETYALKRDGTFKPGFYTSDAATILDQMLTSLFTEPEEFGDDW